MSNRKPFQTMDEWYRKNQDARLEWFKAASDAVDECIAGVKRLVADKLGLLGLTEDWTPVTDLEHPGPSCHHGPVCGIVDELERDALRVYVGMRVRREMQENRANGGRTDELWWQERPAILEADIARAGVKPLKLELLNELDALRIAMGTGFSALLGMVRPECIAGAHAAVRAALAGLSPEQRKAIGIQLTEDK